MASKTTYEGWTNYETWDVNMQLANDESLYNTVLVMADSARADSDSANDARYSLAGQLKELVEDVVYGEDEVLGIKGDLLMHALGMVEWNEIAQSWLDDLPAVES